MPQIGRAFSPQMIAIIRQRQEGQANRDQQAAIADRQFMRADRDRMVQQREADRRNQLLQQQADRNYGLADRKQDLLELEAADARAGGLSGMTAYQREQVKLARERHELAVKDNAGDDDFRRLQELRRLKELKAKGERAQLSADTRHAIEALKNEEKRLTREWDKAKFAATQASGADRLKLDRYMAGIDEQLKKSRVNLNNANRSLIDGEPYIPTEDGGKRLSAGQVRQKKKDDVEYTAEQAKIRLANSKSALNETKLKGEVLRLARLPKTMLEDANHRIALTENLKALSKNMSREEKEYIMRLNAALKTTASGKDGRTKDFDTLTKILKDMNKMSGGSFPKTLRVMNRPGWEVLGYAALSITSALRKYPDMSEDLDRIVASLGQKMGDDPGLDIEDFKAENYAEDGSRIVDAAAGTVWVPGTPEPKKPQKSRAAKLAEALARSEKSD